MVRPSTLAVGKCVYVESVTASPSVALVNMSSSCRETTDQRKARRRNSVPEPQPVEYRGRRQSGADDAWVPSEASTDENSEGWRHTAARVIDGVVRSSDLLVDITDTGGKVSRSVPLWEAIEDDQEEYNDCRSTLLADGMRTTGGCAAPVYFPELPRLRFDRAFSASPRLPLHRPNRCCLPQGCVRWR